jgi:glycine/D-amino acid oxidase-like deaminating enzyme
MDVRLLEYKEKEEKFQGYTIDQLRFLIPDIERQIEAEEPYLEDKINRQRAETAMKVAKLTCECLKLELNWLDGTVPPELAALYRQRDRLEDQDKNLFWRWRMDCRESIDALKIRSRFLWDCAGWINQRKRIFAQIQSSARKGADRRGTGRREFS